MKYVKMILLLLMAYASSYAQQNYAVSQIPKELLSRASAVIRNYDVIVTVKNLNYVTKHVKYAVTVLNKNGERDASLYLDMDNTNDIKYVKGNTYNELGLPISKVNERNFEEHNAADGFSLFNGSRYKSFHPNITTYPYTIEYDYELISKQTLFLPGWEPNLREETGTAVQHSSYKLLCKPDFNIRYKEINLQQGVVTGEADGYKAYSWVIDNLKALRSEPFSPDESLLLPSVKIAPCKFEYADITGTFTNWEQYGAFVYNSLVKSRQYLPAETVEYIKTLTHDITDPKLKAKKIYEYVQQKTRYVSVQIGIGGYQPFPAKDVDQNSYGDCKALVNYTQTLLKAVNIPSYYVLNMAGDYKQNAIPDFASMNQFNHVILCIPFKNDTTWIDCTNKESPFGYLGEFTDDRNVVACTPDGGILMHTPVYKATDNKQVRKATLTLDSKGELSGEMITLFEGTQYDNRDYLVKEGYKEQVKMLKEIYPIENLDIDSFTLKQDKDNKPLTTETIKLHARDYIAQNNNRYYFMPNLGSRDVKTIKDVTNRANPVYINRGYLDEDEISYTLPDGFKIVNKSINITIDKPFGKYTASMRVTNNKLVYKRSLQLNQGTYSKDTYQDLVDFYQLVHDTDNHTIAMEKN